MPLTLIASPRGSGKTTVFNHWCKKFPDAYKMPYPNPFAQTNLLGMSQSVILVDELSRQPLDVQRKILHYIDTKDIYVTLNSDDIWMLIKAWKDYLAIHYPELLI